MKTRTTTFGQNVLLVAIFATALLTSACGDEQYHDDDFAYDTQAYALDSSEADVDYDDEGGPDDSPIEDDAEFDAPQRDEGELADNLRFEAERHRIQDNMVIRKHLDLKKFKEFEFDCQDGADQCAPNTGRFQRD